MSSQPTIPFRSLLASEVRRCLSRRAVHVLVGLAVLGIVATAVVSLLVVDADSVTPPLQGNEYGDGSIANLADLWMDDGDGIIFAPLILLGVGALLGGALVVGGEWKAGTVLTLATWEVRRRRLIVARLLACGVVAAAIAAVLLGLFVAATVPVVLTEGSTAEVDAAWAAGLFGVVGRGLVMVAFAAVLGGAIASLARSATAAFVVLFALNAVIEPVLRGWFPSLGQWLIGENITTFVGGEGLHGEGFAERTPAMAGVLLTVYVAAIWAAAASVFQRRDLGSAT